MMPPLVITLMVIISCFIGLLIGYYSVKFSIRTPKDRNHQPFILPLISSIMTGAFTMKVLVLDCNMDQPQLSFTLFSYWIFTLLLLFSNLFLVYTCGRSYSHGRKSGRRMMDDKKLA